MTMTASSPAKFAESFNRKFTDACREITVSDVRLMAECRLIRRYGYYLRQDLEMVRAVLQYELLRDSMAAQQEREKLPPTCRICGRALPPTDEGKPGRRRQYCPDCESKRNGERQRKLRRRRRGIALARILS